MWLANQRKGLDQAKPFVDQVVKVLALPDFLEAGVSCEQIFLGTIDEFIGLCHLGFVALSSD